MKSVLRFLFAAVFLEFSGVCSSQNIVSPYEAGTWPGFRNAAISYTFDDNCSNQLALAVPMFDSCGFKLTLFTVTGWGPNWNGLKNAASHGHEVANHTASHADFLTLTVEQQAQEISTASNLINANITNQKCITMSTPFCHPGNDSLCALHFTAVRGCQGFIESSTPGNFMNVSSIVCGESGSIKTERDFETNANSAATARGWLVYLIHGIDSDGGYSSLSSGVLRASLAYLNTHKDKFWVTTFGNAAQYIRERNCLSLIETSNQDSSITLQVTDTLDNELYNIPVTIRRPLPLDWLSAVVMQNGLPVNSSIIEIDTIEYLMFDVVPDGGDIVITRNSMTGIEGNLKTSVPAQYYLGQNYPNPFNPATQINYSVPKSSFISLKIFNLLGQEIATLFEGMRQAGNYSETFDGTGFISGVYFYRLRVHRQSGTQVNSFIQTKKLILLK